MVSGEQQEALQQFQDITTCDPGRAHQVLEACGWNLEQAIQFHFASHEEVPAARPAPASASASAQEPLLQPGHETAMQVPGNVVGRAVMFLWSMVRNVASGFFGFFGNFLFGGARGSFTEQFERTYGADCPHPVFFEGPFNDALKHAKDNLKLLVVYLHCDHARDAPRFCREVLADETVRAILDRDFVFWGGDIFGMEAHRISQLLGVRSYPFFAVILPASVEELRLIASGGQRGSSDTTQVVQILTQCLDEMEGHRAEMASRATQHQVDRMLREEQDREYHEALEADRLKAEKGAEEARKRQDAEAAAQAAREAEAAKERDEEKRKERLLVDFQASRYKSGDPEPRSRILMRLPGGQRVESSFRQSDTVQVLHDWASICAKLPENEGKNFEVPPRFQLQTSYPKRELSDTSKTLKELDLVPDGTILLTVVEDDDD
eukprot:CAMPEP_0204345906 /NCGR_PEP_ID=MMETSP0469-20131031/26748_1 /ASSEMBLY_ACC=CAM_ASM_000384 /TAXON_ID=2969 /ORGANISM="Oxyrrhis marina" /LENGTH=435 /DNA_ID=CAMNT_0051331427 /DNA_START=23 /DNA_END=1330 /DNA_ORIENTATION=+